VEQREGDRSAGRRDAVERSPGAYPFGQRPGVRRQDLRKWLAKTGAKTLYIEPGSPWENSYCESFNSKLRDEFLNGEIFYSMNEVQVLAERWRVPYNTVRPHSSLGYRPPAPEAWL
jgi:transposase InsO family protein